MRKRFIFSSALLSSIAFAQSAPPQPLPLGPLPLPAYDCAASHKPAGMAAACAKANAAEAKLYAVYLEVFDALSADPPEQEALTKHYADFRESRGPLCKAKAGLPPYSENTFPAHAKDYACIVEMNRPHEQVLRMWAPGPAPVSVSGDYNDGEGGHLVILGVSRDKAQFELSAVRTAEFHIAFVEGEITLSPDGTTGRAELSTRPPRSPCVLTFDFAARRISVHETDCNSLTGDLAYFYGTYRLMTP